VAVPASRHMRSRLPRPLPALLGAAVATLVLLLAGTTAAHAAPSVADMEKQIDQQWRALEPTIENYNTVHDQLLAQQKKANALQKQIAPLQLQVDLALARVGGYSTTVYETGPAGGLTTLLNAGSTSAALEMLGLIDQMASDQRAQVAGTLKLQQKYEAQKKPIDALVASLSSQQVALLAEAKTIQAQIKKLDALRIKVYGQTYSTKPTRPVPCPQHYTGDAGSKAAQWACNQIGKSYVFGAAGPNTFDCSGLTMRAWESVGVSLPHNAYQQKHSIARVYGSSNLKPGDLVFYYGDVSHVSIYVGSGWMVNAPNSGDVVRMAKYNRYPVNSFGRP
jgi:cell wall-associated NlpC family hydrolase